MRCSIIVLVILALASPAMSQCTTPNQQVTARSACDLPESSAVFSPTDCETADWVFYFDRIPNFFHSDASAICIVIDCLGVDNCFCAMDYPGAQSYTIGPFDDQEIIDTGPGYLVIYGVGWPCRSFANMDLRAYDFK